MAAWRTMLGGLLIWAGHFFTLYILGSVFGTSTPARIGTGIATLVALIAAAVLLVSVRRPAEADPLFRWMASIKALAIGLAIIAVIWQAMPALFA